MKKMTQQLTILSIPCTFSFKNEPLKTKFETAVTEAIDESLSVLGENIKQAIYRQLENKYSIRKEEIPLKIEAFTNTIEFLFGQGAKVIEIGIIEKLHGKIEGFVHKAQKRELFFIDYVADLRSYLESQA
jgi:hypothetical protein